MKAVLIYFLKDPTNPKKGYVGKTVDWDTRFSGHLSKSKSGKNYRCNWIRSLLKRGLKPEFEHVAQVPEIGWEQQEVDYIAAFKSLGFELVNTTDGGDGTKGYVSTPAAREKIRASKLGEKNPNFGKPGTMLGKKHTPEACAKISAAKQGHNPWDTFKSPQLSAAKISAGKLGEKNPNFGKPGTFLGKRHSEESRARMVESQKLRQLKVRIDKLLPRAHYL